MKSLLLALLPALAVAQLGMPGGITETQVGVTDEPVRFAVGAINSMMAQNNGGNAPLLQLVEVVKARTQVVSGQKLYLTLHLTGDYYCDVTVWYQAWNATGNRCKVTDGPTCTRKPATRVGGLAGGVSAGRPIAQDTAPEVMDALNFAACAYNDRSNSMMASMVTDTSSVTYTQQVVAGMKYQFRNVPMGETMCRKQGTCSADLLSNCQANVKGMSQTCSFTVVWAAWQTPKYTLTDFTCN